MDDDTNDIAGTGSKSTIFADLRDNYKPDGLAFVWITRAYLGIFSFFVVSISLTPQMLCAGVDNTILSGCHGAFSI